MGTIYVKYPFGLSVFSSSSHLFTDRLISEARSSKQRHDNDILCLREHLIFSTIQQCIYLKQYPWTRCCNEFIFTEQVCGRVRWRQWTHAAAVLGACSKPLGSHRCVNNVDASTYRGRISAGSSWTTQFLSDTDTACNIYSSVPCLVSYWPPWRVEKGDIASFSVEVLGLALAPYMRPDRPQTLEKARKSQAFP